MIRQTRLAHLVFVLVAGLLTYPAAQADDDEGPPIATPQRVFTEQGVTYVKLDPDTQQAIGLRTTTLKTTTYQTRRTAYGEVVDVSDLLADYQQFASVRARAAQTRAQLAASRAEYRRVSGLYKHQRNVSEKEVQAARATWRSDQASSQEARARLAAARNTIGARWGASIAEWVIEDQPAVEKLSTNKTRLLKLTLPLGETPTQPPAAAQIPLSGGTLVVSLISPAPRVEPDLQGQSYFFLATSGLDDLPYGRRVTGLMSYGPQRRGVIVPDTAVVWSRGSAWVYIKSGPAQFQRQPVRIDAPVPGGWFQASGLSPGAHVVTRGAQVLLSVQTLASAPKGQAAGGDAGGND